ncbi:sigma-54-dependent transcriptional regulator [Spartinivicinus poritis]|uniref:Sigma-54 dependent transcriptional regulator n=1 Tax=Spartinivicinus poritis TaxID=2994640 RepID=A0ABT5UFE4_9GAMM|nr:sigma-54 dependent transcriptional regulator [Spartinivicinus sp. A2-2]MDE1465068.1 sigma-54 dependent transcriptional regulator [Spartinivicinus sp. A2-2]
MNTAPKVLLVDDEEQVLKANSQWLELSGFSVICCNTAHEAINQLQQGFTGVVISDVKMPGIDGLTLLEQAKELNSNLPIILITGHGDVSMAVEALHKGAYDFIEKPFDPDRLKERIQRADEQLQLKIKNQQLRQQLAEQSGISAKLLGESKAIQQVREEILSLANFNTPVLIHGETGCGKELVAQCLHEYSQRANKPFVALNCGAIPEALFESELFGHEAGAFSGAQKQRKGKLEHANGGVVFLDEVESMPSHLQVKLLRALQSGEIERLGSNRIINLDIRVISATKISLKDASEFRQDLYYRLNVSEIILPPLRERCNDIPLLFTYFANLAAEQYQRPVKVLAPSDIDLLTAYTWPGNIRELRNVVTRYILAKDKSIIDLIDANNSKEIEEIDNVLEGKLSLGHKLNQYERQLIHKALEKYQGNISQVMAELDLPRRTLNQKMQKYGLNRLDYLGK